MKRQLDQAPDEGHDQVNRRPKAGNDPYPSTSFDNTDPNRVAMYNSYMASLASYYSTLQQHQLQQQYSTYPPTIYNPPTLQYYLPSSNPTIQSLSFSTSHLHSPASLFYQQQLQQATAATPHKGTPPSSSSSSSGNSPLPPSRTIYLGNITEATKHVEIFDLIKCGPVVEVKLLAEKKCAFIEFLDLPTSLSFFNFYSKSPPLIASSSIPLKVAFAKSSSPVPLNIQAAMNSVPPATRVAYVGGLEESQLNEAYLLDKFSSYGAIESVRMLKEKKTAFIHFVTVASAIKLISLLGSSSPVSLGLPGSKICYGKDRFPVSSARQISEQRLAVPSVAMPKLQTAQNIPMSQFSTFCMQNSHLFKVAGVPAPFTQNHRTIFLGSIPEETCLSDLANVIRGGPLFNLKIVPEKNCAFITFVKASDALLFYVSTVGHRPIISHLEQAVCDSENKPDDSKTNISPDVPGIFVLGRKIYKIGFGKPIDLTNEMLEAIEKGGATRNIYIGLPKKSDALDFFIDELPDDSTIISEFSQYGTIESVVRVPEKQVAFVNFASIVSALKALVGSRSNRVFESCKIIYGKDRCSTQVAAPPYFDSGNPYSVAISNGVGISSQHAPIPNWPIPPPPLPGILPPTFPFQPQAGISPSINYPKN